MNTSELVANLIASLGDDPDEIAHKLTDAGCFGHPRHLRCPAAIYIGDRLPGTQTVGISAGIVMVYPATRVQLTPPLKRFIEKFDHGHYPQLERSEP